MNDAERASEKKDAEAAILATIEAIEAEGREADDWEKKNIADALNALFRGLYRLARCDADLALTPRSQRTSAPIHLDQVIAKLDLARLKAVLRIAELEPVKDPIFG